MAARDKEAAVSTLFLLIISVIALVIVGFFLPVLWIVAAGIVVVGVIYMWYAGRTAAGESDGRSRSRPSRARSDVFPTRGELVTSADLRAKLISASATRSLSTRAPSADVVGTIETTQDAAIRARLDQHRDETRAQQRRLRVRLDADGESPSVLKGVAARVGAAAKGVLDTARGDSAGENAGTATPPSTSRSPRTGCWSAWPRSPATRRRRPSRAGTAPRRRP